MRRGMVKMAACSIMLLVGMFAGTVQASAEELSLQGSQIPENGWYEENGQFYWYEDGVRQGTEGRGKEIYDPESDAWYWLDAVQGGAKAVNKDVYQESASAYPDRPDGTGKWCRYDENGHMVKGWQVTQDGATYYFDPQTGAMAKGLVSIDGKQCGFDLATGVGLDGWYNVDSKSYWYEDGVRQGTEGRGKEIYDPASDAWYWLDAVQDGAKAVNKDVYQESASAYPDRPDGTGKWCRYDENGHMVKGWQTDSSGATYYFEQQTGAMAKGYVVIDGKQCGFDSATGMGLNGWSVLSGSSYWYENGVRQGTEGRGKEIYDPASNAWYWLDAVQGGAMTVNKDVYQESASAYPDRPDGTGKWCRYDENGHMVKGWQTDSSGATYYFDPQTGAMAKGRVTIDGKEYNFDSVTGILQVEMNDFAERVLELINEERQKAGLNPLSTLQKLQEATDKRAEELEILYSHTRPNGTSCFTVLSEYDIFYRSAGENIAQRQRTPEEVMEDWMNSPGHRANILNPKFTHVGVGYYKTSWVQLFIGI